MQTTTKYIELFHLLFLRQLEGKIDKKLYALKGGCNLRFYFKSIRYSEDIDLDITIVNKSTLENKITKLLKSVDFAKILQSKNIQLLQINPSKQTETTQRWKILLKTPASNVPIPTKIEFSRRKLETGILYSPIDNDVIMQHQLYPILCNHYTIDAAFQQKINALIHRTETQARDIFDLKWLLDQGADKNTIILSKEDIETAINNAKSISYTDFKGQVCAYLLDQYQSYYDSEIQWQEILTQVIHALQSTKS